MSDEEPSLGHSSPTHLEDKSSMVPEIGVGMFFVPYAGDGASFHHSYLWCKMVWKV